MNQSIKGLKLLLILLLCAFGSVIPCILVAPLIRIAFLQYSRKTFWMAFLGVIGVLAAFRIPPFLAISLSGSVLCVGLFSEIFKKTKNMFGAGLGSIPVGFGVIVTATQQWLIPKGSTITAILREQLELVMKQTPTVPGIDRSELIQSMLELAPSMLVMVLIISLALALLMQSSLMRLFNEEESAEDQLNLIGFKLPDSFIWIAMLSFLFSFLDLGQKQVMVIASNILYIMVLLYFFQGLAVVEALFSTLRLGFFIRFMTYVIFLFQLFKLVAAIGIIDFWVEFRKKFIRISLNS